MLLKAVGSGIEGLKEELDSGNEFSYTYSIFYHR